LRQPDEIRDFFDKMRGVLVKSVVAFGAEKPIWSDFMKKFMMFVSALFLMSGLSYGGTVNEKCPISGKAIGDAKSTVELGVCCGKCKKKVEADPGKYLAKVATTEDGKCVISGKGASKNAEITVGFCCGKCKGKFDDDVKAHVGKVEVAEK